MQLAHEGLALLTFWKIIVTLYLRSTLYHHHDPNLYTGGGNCIKHFDIIMPLFWLRIYGKVYVPPQIFQSPLTYGFVHLFIIMIPAYIQEEVIIKPFDRIMSLLRLKIYIYLKYFKIILSYCQTLRKTCLFKHQ